MVRLWDIDTQREIAAFNGVVGVSALSPNGKILASIPEGNGWCATICCPPPNTTNMVKFWNLDTENPAGRVRFQLHPQPLKILADFLFAQAEAKNLVDPGDSEVYRFWNIRIGVKIDAITANFSSGQLPNQKSRPALRRNHR